MLKVEHLEVWGFEHAIRGMRNPMNSWDRSDSQYEYENVRDSSGTYVVGSNDLELMRKLYLGGTEHRKFMRQICISLDITAPLYWWKEFDTYVVGVVKNSCSTMHKIHAKEFVWEDFSAEHLLDEWFDSSTLGYGDAPAITPNVLMDLTIEQLNNYRGKFLDITAQLQDNNDGEGFDPVVKQHLQNEAKKWWWQMIQLLPSSYNQKRTITMNYENAAAITHQRHNHKLDEWRYLVGLLIEQLPYFAEIIGKEKA